MSKELKTLKEVMRSCIYVHAADQVINELEDKPDARAVDVLRHMIAERMPARHAASMLCYIAEARVLTMAELFDAAKEVYEAYPSTRYPLEEHGSERDILRQYTSDEDVRVLIERRHKKFIWRSPFAAYMRIKLLKLNERTHCVTLASKGLSFESVLAIMAHSSKELGAAGKDLCSTFNSEETHDYDVYAEVIRDGLCPNGKSYASTDDSQYYRPLTREEFEAARLVAQITH